MIFSVRFKKEKICVDLEKADDADTPNWLEQSGIADQLKAIYYGWTEE